MLWYCADRSDPRCRAQVRKGLSLIKPQWIYESIQRGKKLPLIKSWVCFVTCERLCQQAEIHSLLVKASDKDQQGRYYDKSLEDIDSLLSARNHADPSLVLPEQDEEEELEEEEEVTREPDLPASPIERGGKSDRQQAMENEWGLYRNTTLSQKSEEDEEGDTDDERRRDSPDNDDEEEFMVSFPTLG